MMHGSRTAQAAFAIGSCIAFILTHICLFVNHVVCIYAICTLTLKKKKKN